MAFKFVVFLAAVACANAGFLSAPAAVSYSSPVYAQHQVPAITTQHQNILRSPGNLAQVSTYSKTIDTPFSSVSKHDVRVSNPGYVSATYAAPAVHATYAAPAVHTTYAAAPAVHATYAATPVVHSAPVLSRAYASAPVYAKTYAAPAVATYAAPAVATYAAPAVAHTYAAPAVAHTYAAPAVAHTYAAPALAQTYSSPVVAKTGLLGVAYSAAPAVAHVEYHGHGLNYVF